MRRQNLPERLIVYISRVIPVYVSHIYGLHDSELSGAVPIIARKGIVQNTIPCHLGDVIVLKQTRNDFVLLHLGLGT